MKQAFLTVAASEQLTASVYKMKLTGDVSAITAPGQFINIKLDGLFLRRPISVYDLAADAVTIIYKTVGNGTEKMAKMPVGTVLDVLTGLGNGYDLAAAGAAPLLVGGGVGVPPLYYLAKKLIAAGKPVTAILGFNTATEIFAAGDFEALGARVFIATADGSVGTKGFVTDVMKGLSYSYFYACGPEPMLRAVAKISTVSGEMSFEERMGCGFGACMGCSCKTLTGNKRICREGPVMKKEEILWEN